MIVERMDVLEMPLRFSRSFNISRGRIGDVGSRAPHVLVKLFSSPGSGWGECRPSHLWSYETRETVLTTLDRYLRGCIEGEDPSDLESLHTRMDSVIAPGVTRGQPIAKSGIDIAAHDLFCRHRGISLSEHLGGGPEAEMPLSFIVSAGSAEEAAAQVRGAAEDGYSGFKIKIGHGVERDLRMIEACREEAADAFLWADANQAYGREDSISLADKANRHDLDILEQPLISTDRHGLVELAEHSPVTVAIDESVFTAEDLSDFISLGFRGAVVIKAAKSGGIHPARRMIELARRSNLEILGSGLTESMVGFSASLQLFCASGMRLPADLNGPQFLEDDVTSGPLVDRGVGRATGPGLGVEVDQRGLSRPDRSLTAA